MSVVPSQIITVNVTTKKNYVSSKGVVGGIKVFPQTHSKVGIAGGRIFPHGCAIVLEIEGPIKFKIIVFEAK